MTGDASICNMITYMAHETGIGMSTKNQIWGSDSNTFAWKSIPAMTLNRDGFGMHTRHDTIALLSDWSLERSAILLGYIAYSTGKQSKFFRLNGKCRKSLSDSWMNILANVIPAVYIILAESIPHLTNERQIDTLSQERFFML